MEISDQSKWKYGRSYNFSINLKFYQNIQKSRLAGEVGRVKCRDHAGPCLSSYGSEVRTFGNSWKALISSASREDAGTPLSGQEAIVSVYGGGMETVRCRGI